MTDIAKEAKELADNVVACVAGGAVGGFKGGVTGGLTGLASSAAVLKYAGVAAPQVAIAAAPAIPEALLYTTAMGAIVGTATGAVIGCKDNIAQQQILHKVAENLAADVTLNHGQKIALMENAAQRLQSPNLQQEIIK